jgi:hypothetical protein
MITLDTGIANVSQIRNLSSKALCAHFRNLDEIAFRLNVQLNALLSRGEEDRIDTARHLLNTALVFLDEMYHEGATRDLTLSRPSLAYSESDVARIMREVRRAL